MGVGPTTRAWARRRGRSKPGRPRADGRDNDGGSSWGKKDDGGSSWGKKDDESHHGTECRMLIRIWDLLREKGVTVKKKDHLGAKRDDKNHTGNIVCSSSASLRID
ncbi:hypothetical protein YC2023_067759 [Brassica napus]